MITIKYHLGYKPDKIAICPGQCLLSLYRSGHLENLSVQWCLNTATVRSGHQVHITHDTQTHQRKCVTGSVKWNIERKLVSWPEGL